MQTRLQIILERGIERGFKYEPLQMTDGVHSVVMEVPEEMIFRHILLSKDFAKAYFGEDLVKYSRQPVELKIMYLWEIKLQEAVISEDLIKYYEDNPN